jgi:iron complex outermembrane recepter protein
LSEAVKFRLSGSWRDTNGYIPNTFLKEDADAVKDLAICGNPLIDDGGPMTLDFRASYARLEMHPRYFNIVNDANNVSLPVRVL